MGEVLELEVWRPVVGYEWAYEVSSLGRVRSKNRVTGRGAWKTGRLLCPCPSGRYLSLRLTDFAGRVRTKMVHQMVCEAFHGPPPSPKHEVCHEGDRWDDNRARCLRWGTRAENLAEAVQLRGGRHWRQKLSDEQVQAILDDPRSQRTIGREYGVSSVHVGHIKRGTHRRRVARLAAAA